VTRADDDDVIDALATNAPEKALAEGVHPGDPHGGAEDSDPCPLGRAAPTPSPTHLVSGSWTI
jgi:hypothetical protein